ncbi:MAG: tetratricopeptide repeat protein [Candidatus Cybelea sp.]
MEDEGRITGSSEFGNLLRRLRLAAGLSQETLADRARISTNGIGALERGYRRNPQRETVALLARALTLSPEQRQEFEAAARSGAPQRIGARSNATRLPQDRTTSNLPWALTSFVGRERDLAEIKGLLDGHRLLTLVGSGGVGKTRLAIQVGAKLLDCYSDGVWFVDLAPISDRSLVASVVAQALGMSQQQGRRVEESIPLWLKRNQVLLIFDNCEHVLEAIAALADAILTAAQGVRILATSRQALNISGEVVHRLSSLAVPNEATDFKAKEALGYEAIELFVDRATAADTRFALTDNNAPIIAEICRRLDGIALAIELAAARVTVLSIPNLAQRLNERFKILTGGSRSALPRQKTLTALIDWSYNLLNSQEQILFARLGIFAGGFGLDAATAVCRDDGLDEIDVFDLITSLTDKSLVVADISGETERYRLLESTVAYALEKLSAAGGRERLAQRHAEYFRDQATDADERFGSGSTVAWVADIKLELDNYRAALEWALRRDNDAVLGGAIAGALSALWWNAGLIVEGRHWTELALSRVSDAEHPAIAARLHSALSFFSDGKARYDAAERALQLYRSVSDRRGIARAEQLLGFALFQMGRLDTARETMARALAAFHANGDMWSMALCLSQLGYIERSRGDLSAARELFTRALSGMRSLGNELGIAMALGKMADLEFTAGDSKQALSFATEALELESLGENLELAARWHVNTAAYRIALGDLTEAHASLQQGLRLAQQGQEKLQLAVAIQHLALLAALGGDAQLAARLLGYVDVGYDQLGMKREPTEQWGYDKLLTALRKTLSDDEIKRFAAEGAAWSEDQAVEKALKI